MFFWLFCVIAGTLGAAPYVSLEEYAAKIGNIDSITHRIPTLNQNGAAMCFTTELTEAFLEYCRDPNCTSVLEVGCAYGIKASQIVQTGVFLVANDIDERHLTMMQATFSDIAKTDPHFKNVEYLTGDIATFSQEELGSKKYDAILCESVLHFMYPQEVRDALSALYRSLKPSGRIYITVMSGYLENYRDVFARQKAQGIGCVA